MQAVIQDNTTLQDEMVTHVVIQDEMVRVTNQAICERKTIQHGLLYL